MRASHLPANGFRRERWRNGAGWTREIHRHPEGHGDWDWRVSIAEIDQDAPFSPFPGCDRILVLLQGAGVELAFDDGETVALEPPHGRHGFTGERGLTGRLVDGPTHDFNLIWRRDQVRAELLHRPLVGPMVFFREAGVRWLAYLIRGEARLKDATPPILLSQGDALLLEPDDEGPSRMILEGGGELLLARLSAP